MGDLGRARGGSDLGRARGPDLDGVREGVPVGTPALDLEPLPRSCAVARSSHGKMEAALVALAGSTGDPRGVAMCLLQGTASHVSTPSSDIRVAGWVPRQSPFCWERSTRAPQVLCGPAGTLWQSLARLGVGTAPHRRGCCYKVNRAKVSHPYRELHILCRVLICAHASPTPGKSVQDRRRRPELC